MFDLSYEKKMTADLGKLYPIMHDEMIPGDFFQIGNQAVIRFQPMVAPILHEIYMYTHYFFVPYRILWDDWEDFITGGVDGEFAEAIPEWEPTTTAKGSLWDYMGMPVGVDPAGAYPVDFIRRAYNLIYNEYYRDQTLQIEVALDQETILIRNWEKDYFTSSLPWQQRGPAPALPIAGYTSAVFAGNLTSAGTLTWPAPTGDATYGSFEFSTSLNPFNANTRNALQKGTASSTVLKTGLDNNVVDLSTASTFDIADLRIAFSIQKWMERNARAGARYTEFLQSHFGVSPRDERLQRPEYIGGSKSPIIISEVLQTSSTDATTPQGNLAGHGITISDSYCGKYSAKEFGVVIGIMSVMPRPSYQQGINRQWLRKTKYDFPFPEFVNLSEQAIQQAEIYATAVPAENETIFGYQGRYDECRVKHNLVCGDMRDTYDYWHVGRQFSTPPLLNESFIQCVPRKDFLAVPTEPAMLVSFGNIIKAFRPLPIQSEPGLIDH